MNIALQFLLFVLYLVNAVKLPGKCPVVPPTHLSDPYLEANEIVLSIPFAAETPTYLFRSLNESSMGLPWLFIFKTNKTISGFELTNLNQGPTYTSLEASVIEGSSNESLSINGTIVTSHDDEKWAKECHRPLQEKVRIWFEGDFGILWSCVDVEGAEDHDEAAILIAYPPPNLTFFFKYQYERRQYKKMMLRLKPVAEKYLQKNLVDAMNWTKEPTGDPLYPTYDTLYWFPC